MPNNDVTLRNRHKPNGDQPITTGGAHEAGNVGGAGNVGDVTPTRPNGEVDLPPESGHVIGETGSSGHSNGASSVVDVQTPGAIKVGQPQLAYALDNLGADARAGIHDTNSLNLQVANEHARGRELLGPIVDGKQLFTHTTIMTLGDALEKVIGAKAQTAATTAALKAGKPQAEAEQIGQKAAADAVIQIKPLIDATKTPFPIVAPRHLNRLPELNGEYGQRVLYIPQGEENAKDLRNLLLDLQARGCMLDKNKVHSALEYPGGPPTALAEGESVQNGVTHGGRISISKYNGAIMWYDKPADYGRTTSTSPTDGYWDYLTVFDPNTIKWNAPTKPTVEVFKQWAENADIWAALDILTVEFANAHPNPAYRSYKRNPVEIQSANDLPPFASSILTAANGTAGDASRTALEKLHSYAEYCEEGKTNNKNLGLNVPLNERSVREGRLSADAFAGYKKMVEVFQSAEGWQQDPSKGWKQLLDKGYINQMQLGKLESTGYINQALIVQPETLRPWTYYQPDGVETDKTKDGYGLFARPVTLAALAGNFIGSNIPQEMIADGFAKQAEAVLKKDAQDPAKQILVKMMSDQGLIQGQPTIESMTAGAGAFSRIMAAGFQGLFMHSMKDTFFEKLRVNEMGADDQKKIGEIFGRFSDAVFDPQLALDREARIKKIMEIDEEFRNITVTLDGVQGRPIQFFSPVQGVEGPRGGPFMPTYVGHHHLAIGVKSGFQQ